MAGRTQAVLHLGKNGAPSGVTFGELNGVKQSCRIPGNFGKQLTREYTIVGDGSGRFSDGGDSGSVDVNETGIVLGLLFAGKDVLKPSETSLLSYYIRNATNQGGNWPHVNSLLVDKNGPEI